VPVSNFPFNSRGECPRWGGIFPGRKCPGNMSEGEKSRENVLHSRDQLRPTNSLPIYLTVKSCGCCLIIIIVIVRRLMSGPRLVGGIHGHLLLDVHGRIVRMVSVFAFSATSATPSQRLALWVTGCWWRDAGSLTHSLLRLTS